MRYLPVLILLLSAGCAGQKLWEKPGASAREFEMEKGQCEAQAYSVPGMHYMQVGAVFNACMRGKGWYLVDASPTHRERRTAAAPREDYKLCNDEAEQRAGTRNIFDETYKMIYGNCMRSRGHSAE
jgi:hypothetical protein